MPRKRFRIQKRRLGAIKFVQPEKDFGFIDAEDFPEDVFFHLSVWDGERPDPIEGGLYVEYELDDDHFDETKRYRAKVVRVTDRPQGKKLTAKDASFDFTHHHPNARRRKPTWRST
ncbi:MAG: cold shock domain-containing protein [Planctomycetota bacterium]